MGHMMYARRGHETHECFVADCQYVRVIVGLLVFQFVGLASKARRYCVPLMCIVALT